MITRRRAAPALFIVLFAAVFFAPELSGSRVMSTAAPEQWLPWAQGASESVRAEPSFNPDYLTSYYPRRALFRAAWQDGELPLWNPYSFAGMPFLADPQAGVLYPPNWLLLPMDPARALGWFVFLHVAWGGIGVWRLLRRRDVPEPVAMLGGAAFVLSGFFVKHFGLPPFLATAAWLPWVALATERAVDRPGSGSAARLGLVGALTFLAGQPQLALLAGYGAALLAIVYAATTPRRQPRRLAGVALTLGGAGALAILLVSAQLLPTLELAGRSARARLPYETVISGAFHPVDAIRFLVPEFFGTALARDEWSGLFPRGDSFYLRNQLNSLFAGSSVFLLALGGMCHPRTWRSALPFTVLFVVAVLLAFGTVLSRFAYAWVPGFSIARIDRVGALVVFAQFVPAALLAAELVRPGSWRRRLFGSAIVVSAIAGALAVSSAGADLPALLGAARSLPSSVLEGLLAGTRERTLVAAGFAAATGLAFWLPGGRAGASIPFALACLQLFLFAIPYRADREPDRLLPETPDVAALRAVLDSGAPERASVPGAGGTRFVRFGRTGAGRVYPLSNALPPSMNAPFRLRDLQGYNALSDRQLGDALELATGEPLFSHGIWAGRRIVTPNLAASLQHPLFDALSVGAAIGTEPLTGWPLVSEPGAFSIHRNDSVLPRVRLTPSGRGVSAEELARRLVNRDLDPTREVLWIASPDVEGSRVTVDPSGQDAETGQVTLLVDGWNRVTVRTQTPSEAVLVVADSHDPGWRATLDGDSVPILAAWGLVRAVVVPSGEHVVEMSYEPREYRLGSLLSLLGLVLTGGLLARPSRPAALRAGPGSIRIEDRFSRPGVRPS